MGEYNKFSFELQNLTKLNGAMSGDYVLLITKQLGSKPGPAIYKNCAFRVTNGHFSILQYDKVISENARIDKNANKKKKASAFKKTNLSDVKPVSNQVVKGATTDYEKLLKIYEYVAENFYYDNVAFRTSSKQYVDPYKNLYNMRNKKKSKMEEWSSRVWWKKKALFDKKIVFGWKNNRFFYCQSGLFERLGLQ